MNMTADSIMNPNRSMNIHEFFWAFFCSASSFCAWTISLPLPVGTILTLGSLGSSGLW